jgi:hypothetical protein
MKTISTLLLSTIFSIAAMAYDGTRLTVSTLSTSRMFVEVDGRRYNFSGNTVSISNIRPGTHNVRVLREVKRNNRGWGIGIGNKKEEVIYSIKATLKNGYHFDILVNRFGKVMIDERMIDGNDDWYAEEDDDYYDKTRDRDRDREEDRPDRDPRYDDHYSRTMSDIDFNQAKETLRKEWFENTRLSSAMQIIDRNYFNSQQVKELMFLFTFENNRLDIAKYAYGKTVDKERFFVVNEAITFSGNKEKLNEYIREYEEKY